MGSKSIAMEVDRVLRPLILVLGEILLLILVVTEETLAGVVVEVRGVMGNAPVELDLYEAGEAEEVFEALLDFE